MIAAPDALLSLVARFDHHVDAYRSGRYNETQVRREFIDPLFVCLGWDVNNERGYAEAYKDVVHEDAIRIGGATKAPDYSFRVGGARKFFVEAKKPSVNVGEDVSAAYQLRRYAWSAKLPLSILTDFEELAVYDCRLKPNRSDGPATARIMHLQYRDYAARWDELAGVFSREAVLQGSFDGYAASNARKRGTAEVDDAFLEEIDAWREQLARNLALRNPELTSRQLNDAVQRTIDRIIFLRITEDRGIEPYGRLMALLNGGDTYQRLCDLYRQADERYNSGLFHFRQEAGRSEPPDDLTPNLILDDRALKEILRRLYYPDSPYEFSVLPADILGQVYERFLGKVIRLTAGHQARVDVKPEVKKAGGVFYTPTYIVDYIVEHTLGPLLENKTVRQVGGEHRGAPLRVVDPACGSGSFLLGAYQYLLDWYRDRYVADDPLSWATGGRPRLFQGAEGEWRLTTAERRRILLNHIHGVDIDPQAVEVTKLSLLLKVLEGESGQRLATQLAFMHERALPDLGSNIKCGNALIGSDYYRGRQMAFLDEDERYRVNAFDWEVEFAEIMAAGGFDAVIGNPPYVFGETLQADQKEYFETHYRTARGQYDTYWLFTERAVGLLAPEGYVAMIVPDALLARDEAAAVRRVLSDSGLSELYHCGSVFPGVGVSAVVYVADLANDTDDVVVYARDDTAARVLHRCSRNGFRENRSCRFTIYIGDEERPIVDKIMECSMPLGNLVHVSRGEEMGKRNLRAAGTTPILVGEDIQRYSPPVPTRYLDRVAKKESYYEGPKILMVKTGRHVVATVDKQNTVTLQSLYNLQPRVDSRYRLEYLLACMNSHLTSFYASRAFTGYKKLFPQFNQSTVSRLPIRTLDFSNPADVARHDRLVSLVEAMLALHEQLAAARTPGAKTLLQRQIDASDREIDALVYELYDLTPEEIRIVEEETRRA